MATCLFRSPLAFRLQCFLETRKAAGRRGVSSQKLLIGLDRFLLSELQPGETITREIADLRIKSLESLSIGTRINHISVLRQFCRYLAHFDPRTCVVHRSFLPRRTRPAPYIYSRKEVQRIMAAARRIEPPKARRRRWPFIVAGVVVLGAGCAAAAQILRSKRNTEFVAATDPMPGSTPSGSPADHQEMTDTAHADVNGQVRTP